MSDGSDGLVLVASAAGGGRRARARAAPRSRPFAAAAARRLAGRAPEIATTDPDAADGRAFIDVAAVRAAAAPSRCPYSLVPPGTDHAVVPLTLDELAAITAGMPADFSPATCPTGWPCTATWPGRWTGTPDAADRGGRAVGPCLARTGYSRVG